MFSTFALHCTRTALRACSTRDDGRPNLYLFCCVLLCVIVVPQLIPIGGGGQVGGW